MTYTHIGFRRAVGYIHSARLYGHSDYSGKRHALVGLDNIYSGAAYKTLCGKTVVADHDGQGFNLWPKLKGMADGAGVTCKRCQAALKRQPTTEPIPDDCLPFNGDEQKLRELLRGPQVGSDGKIKDGVYAGMTPEQVLADRDAYNRACGE